MTQTRRWILLGATDLGRQRTRNEDSFVVLPDQGIAVVADGMGGHPAGDVASDIAARTIADALTRMLTTNEGRGSPEDVTSEGQEHAMRRSVLEAHEAILEKSRWEPGHSGMGTTATVLLLDPRSPVYTLGNVGDSRIYRWREGILTQLTRDDTWLEARIEAGHIRREDARGHPKGHLLTQCLGLAQTPQPWVSSGTVDFDDVFLLCSDGLVTCVSDSEIERTLTGTLDGTEQGARQAVAKLIEQANAGGGVDNITVVVALTPHSV